jgi:mannose/fructose/N-acetylgalactosamine-specific phosphotransferase system component IIC
MPLDPAAFLALVLVGGAVAIDGTSFGQFMISRPLVAAALGGWIAGDPVHGALIGLVLEAFQLAVLPVGAAKYPEGGPAALAGGAVYASSNLAPSTLLLTTLAVLLLEWVGGESVRQLRLANIRLVAPGHGTPVTAAGLEQRHRTAIAVDFLRGMVLVALGTVVLAGVVRFAAPLWGLGERIPQVVLTAAVAGLIASALRIVGGRAWFAAAGAAAGIAYLLAR